MMMLSVVCVLDWNHNVDRPGKKDKNGKQLFKSKIDRTRKKTVITEVKVAKSYEYQDVIHQNCLDCLLEDNIPKVNYPIDFELVTELKRKRKESYKKDEAVEKFMKRSRMKKTVPAARVAEECSDASESDNEDDFSDTLYDGDNSSAPSSEDEDTSEADSVSERESDTEESFDYDLYL